MFIAELPKQIVFLLLHNTIVQHRGMQVKPKIPISLSESST